MDSFNLMITDYVEPNIMTRIAEEPSHDTLHATSLLT